MRTRLARARLAMARLARARLARARLVKARLARARLALQQEGCAEDLKGATYLAASEGRRLLFIPKLDILFVVYRFNNTERVVMKVKKKSGIERVLLISSHLFRECGKRKP